MLLLVLSLHTVTTIASRKPLPARPALRMSIGACTGTTACTVDPDDQYRVDSVDEPALDRKAQALGGYWKRCGVTGMPVCPATRGRVRYSMAID